MEKIVRTKEDYLTLLQETIDYYTVEGNARSLNEMRRCQYLNENGDRCALGRLMRKDAYHKTMEGKDAYFMIAEYEETVLKKIYRGYKTEFYQKLQDLHDGYHYFEKFDNGGTYLSHSGLIKVEDIKQIIDTYFDETNN